MKIEFSTDNAAFYNDNSVVNYWARATEISRILKRIIDEVNSGLISGPIIDINGHTIGKWEL